MKIFWLLLTFFCCVDCRSVVFVGKRVVCNEYNKNYFYNITCGVRLASRDKQLYSLYGSMKPVAITNLHVRMQSFYKFRTEYRPLGIKLEEDACFYFKYLNGTKILDVAHFSKFTTVDLNCPIQGPKTVTMTNYEIIPWRLPDFAPIGDWHFDTVTYTIVDGKEILLIEFINFFETRYKYD